MMILTVHFRSWTDAVMYVRCSHELYFVHMPKAA
jgi:hypothetical protein